MPGKGVVYGYTIFPRNGLDVAPYSVVAELVAGRS